MSSFRGISDVISAKGLFSSFYSDRGSHYWVTSKAGGKVDRDNLTQVGRALKQLMIEHIAAYSPEARGRSERMFGTLQNRLPQELRLAGVRTMEEANRYLIQTYLPAHNRRFSIKAEGEGTAFVAYAGSLDDVLCVHEERIVSHDNTVRYNARAAGDGPGTTFCKSRRTGTGITMSRPRSWCTNIRTGAWPSSTARESSQPSARTGRPNLNP